MPNNRFVSLSLAFWLLAMAQGAQADQIMLKNGDRISGAITSSDTTILNIKTDYAGTIALKRSAIQSIASDQPLYVTSKSGQVLLGTITTADNTLQVATKESGTVSLSKDAVDALRSESEQRAYGAWSGAIDTGLSLSRGNANTTTFTIGAAASRTTSRDKTSVFVTSLYSKAKSNGVNLTTASAIDGGLRYDFNLGKRTFAFAFTDFDHDRFQLLDLRNVIGGGLGYHAIKSEATTLDLYGGASLNQEFFSTGLNRRTGELLVGEDLDHKLSAAFSIKERLEFYPNLSSLGNYRVVFDSAAVTRISRVLSWQIALSDRYISNPILGLKGNNLLLTTGVRVTFGPSKGL